MTKKRISASGGVIAFVIALIIASSFGWISNIIKLYSTCCDVSGELVIRAIGIFLIALGAIMGYF